MNNRSFEVLYAWCMTVINLVAYFALTLVVWGLGFWFAPLIGFFFISGICTYSYTQLKKLNAI